VNEVSLTIDGIQVRAKKGEKILWAALDAGIYIPNLCAIREAELPLGSCRLCFVEIEGRGDLVTACTEPITEGMVVYTETPRVKRLRHTAFELLLASHAIDCRNCARKGNCEFVKVARYLGIKLKSSRFRKVSRNLPVDETNPYFIYDPNKCVLCGKCVWICHEKGEGIIDFSFRGINTVITTIGNDLLADSRCISCGECVAICPVGALVSKDFCQNS
jgi:formate dehydrogenase major subunit/NADH-quinone oxidoreductase subunit G